MYWEPRGSALHGFAKWAVAILTTLTKYPCILLRVTIRIHSLFSSLLLLLQDPRLVIWVCSSHTYTPPPPPSFFPPLLSKLASLSCLGKPLFILRSDDSLPLKGRLKDNTPSMLGTNTRTPLTLTSFSRSHLWGALNLIMWWVFSSGCLITILITSYNFITSYNSLG